METQDARQSDSHDSVHDVIGRILDTASSMNLELDSDRLLETFSIGIDGLEWWARYDCSDVSGIIGILLGFMSRLKKQKRLSVSGHDGMSTDDGIDYNAFIKYASDINGLDTGMKDAFFWYGSDNASKSSFVRMSATLAFKMLSYGMYKQPTCIDDAVNVIGLMRRMHGTVTSPKYSDMAYELSRELNPMLDSLHNISQLDAKVFNCLHSRVGIRKLDYALNAVLGMPSVVEGLRNGDRGVMNAVDSLSHLTYYCSYRLMSDEKAVDVFNTIMTIPEEFRSSDYIYSLFGLFNSLDRESLRKLTSNGFFSDWSGTPNNAYLLTEYLEPDGMDYRDIDTVLRAFIALGFVLLSDNDEYNSMQSIACNGLQIVDDEDSGITVVRFKDDASVEALLDIGISGFIKLLTVLTVIMDAPSRWKLFDIDEYWLMPCLQPMTQQLYDDTNAAIFMRWLMEFTDDVMGIFEHASHADDYTESEARKDRKWSRFLVDTMDSLQEAMTVPYGIWKMNWLVQHDNDEYDDWTSGVDGYLVPLKNGKPIR